MMAKINVEFDSVNKNLAVFVDGQPLPGVQNVYFYGYDDVASMEMSLKPDKYEGMVSHLRVCAANDPKIEGKTEDFTEDKSLVKHTVASKQKRFW
jgi:hypothetical protein